MERALVIDGFSGLEFPLTSTITIEVMENGATLTESFSITIHSLPNQYRGWQSGVHNSFLFKVGEYRSVTLPIFRGNGKISYELFDKKNSSGNSIYSTSLPAGLKLVHIDYTHPPQSYVKRDTIPVLRGTATTAISSSSYCFKATDEEGNIGMMELKISATSNSSNVIDSFDSTLSTSSCDD